MNPDRFDKSRLVRVDEYMDIRILVLDLAE